MASQDNKTTKKAPAEPLGVNGSSGSAPVRVSGEAKPAPAGFGGWIRSKWNAAREKRHSYISPGRHGCLSAVMYLAFILGISMIIASLVILAANDVFSFVKPDMTVVVDIPEEAEASDVADILHEAGVISYPKLFVLYTRLAKKNVTYKSGAVEVDASLDYSALISSLRYREPKKVRETVRVTIPEGYTTAQIIGLLADNDVAKEDALWAAVINEDFGYEFLNGRKHNTRRLEGYLFPDTYEFYVNGSAASALDKLLSNFDKHFTAGMRKYAEDNGKTLDEIVIVASLIEREAQIDDERAKVASVIYNRLASSDYPYLQIDATVQYITGNDPTPEDLEIDDPYNTYKYEGLPPTAIANPGAASLQAALNPADTEYYFYVVSKEGGTHVFSKTYEEHLAAIAALGG